MVETRSCPICWHEHLDYLFEEGTDEACVSCGCLPTLAELLTAVEARALARVAEAVWRLPWHSHTSMSYRDESQIFLSRMAVLALVAEPHP